MSRSLAVRRGLRASLVTALFMLPTSAAWGSSPSDQAAAQALFDDGLKLLELGDFHSACPKLEASEKLDPTISTAYQLGRCFEAIGRTASAWGMYVAAADKAKSKHNDRAEKAAREKASSLEFKLSRILLSAKTPLLGIPGLVISRDGVEVSPGGLGTAVPVDPGPHEIVVRAPGRRSWRQSALVPNEPVVTSVPLPETLELEATQPSPEERSAIRPPPPTETSRSPWQTVGWIGAGTGVAVLAVGGALAISAKSAFDSADEHCTANVCEGDYAGKRNDAFARGNVATGFFVAGTVLTAAGLTLAILAPHKRAPSSTTVSVTSSGLVLRGQF